jgi:hypothetical protein
MVTSQNVSPVPGSYFITIRVFCHIDPILSLHYRLCHAWASSPVFSELQTPKYVQEHSHRVSRKTCEIV